MMKMFVIDELRIFDLPKHCKSTAKFITDLLSFVDELINKKKSVYPILVIQKLFIKRPANNPCLMLLVNIQFGYLKLKLSNQNPLA